MVDEEYDFVNDSGKGSEELKVEDYQPPFLIILQSNSPQVMEGNQQYVEDARPGRIFSTVSRQCYKECHVIPIRVAPRDVEWKTRSSGGGFVGYHERGSLTDITVDKLAPSVSQAQKRSNGNVVTTTYYMLCLLEEEGWDKIILPMYSTQIKIMRRWIGLIESQKTEVNGQKVKLAYFSAVYKLSTVQESNRQGTWYSWKVELERRLVGDKGQFISDDARAQYLLSRNTHQEVIDFLPKRLLPLFTNDDANETSNGTDEEPF